jgi:hypothetical protein
MNKTLITLAFLFTLIISTTKTFAWGSKGHALVAQVAFNYIDENTKKEVLKYLNGMSIEDAANWMDNVKSDHTYDYMRAYHYVNFDKGATVLETEGDNIIFQLNTTIKELQNKEKLSKEEINHRIKILFHLIGDLHQPLHVRYGEDKGGNTMQINYNSKGTNLHSHWDSGIIEYKNISLPDCLNANKYSVNERRALQYLDVVFWATDSRSYLPLVYKTGGNKINDEYIDGCVPIIKTQILKTGIRLAGVLNDVFKN